MARVCRINGLREALAPRSGREATLAAVAGWACAARAPKHLVRPARGSRPGGNGSAHRSRARRRASVGFEPLADDLASLAERPPTESDRAARGDHDTQRGRAAILRPVALVDLVLPRPLDRRGLGSLAFGHLSVDLSQGIVPPLLPFLVSQRGYSFAAAGSLALFASFGSSLIQPLLGAFADRIHASWMLYAGPLVAAVGVAFVGFTASYAATAAALAVMSVGVAMYHPEAVRTASQVSAAGGLQGTGMSVFALGGMSGWTLGPLLVTPAVLLLGFEGTALVAAVPLVASVLLYALRDHLQRFRQTTVGAAAADPGESRWLDFALAAGAGITRSGVQFGVQSYVGLYVWRVLDTSEAIGNWAIATFMVAGAIGTGVGGRIADRFTFERLVLASLGLTLPFVLLLPRAGLVSAFVLCFMIGLVMEANFYPLVVLAQRAVPRHVGFAAGVMLGASIGVSAVIVALLGVVADRHGLQATLWACAGLAVLAFVQAAALVRRTRRT